MAKNLGLEAKFKSLEDWEQNLHFHSLKSSLASYSSFNLFLTFRWVWDFWKWFQTISHGPKHGLRSPNQVSRRLRTKFTVSLLEVVLGLLQPLHPILDLQMGLSLLKVVPNDCPCPKTWGLYIYLACYIFGHRERHDFSDIFFDPPQKSWNRQKIQKRRALYFISFQSC